MSLASILLIIFLIIILRPVIRAVIMFRRYKKAVNNAYSNAYKQYSHREEPREPVHKKVFTKDMGEYVAFEEISVETTTETISDDKNTVTYTTEEQIADVEWVEIK